MNFHEFSIPAKLNGDQLKVELGCDSVYVRGDKLIIAGDLTFAQAQAGLSAHVPIVKVLTPEEKLFAATGLTPAEYKALGL